MGGSRAWRWADGVVATGEGALALLNRARVAGDPSLVIGEPHSRVRELIVRSLGESDVEVLTPGEASEHRLAGSGHVVVDVSDSARALDIVGELLDMELVDRFAGQLQVVTAASSHRSDVTSGAAVTEPYGGATRRKTSRVRLWVPILSEGYVDGLATLYRQLAPDHVCPVLPLPARNVRRADDLLLEYRAFLFDCVRIEIGNIIYANESDPFDLYGTLGALAEGREPSTFVVSPTEAGLRALGAFLAAHVWGFGLVWAFGSGRAEPDRDDPCTDSRDLTCVWLTGEPYTDTDR